MDPNMTSLLTEQLSERAARDPFAALLLQQLSRQSESVEGGGQDVLERRLERASRAITRLRSELTAANAMAAHVARVLGACPACWGLDRFCRRCLGAGTPGSDEPDINALIDWVAPALHRAGVTVSTLRPAVEQTGRPLRSDDGGS